MYQPGMKKRNLLGRGEKELVALAVSLGEEPFRGRQLYQWIYQRKELDFERMAVLPKSFRRRLSEEEVAGIPRVVQRQVSADGTIKFLLQLEDGRCVESVFIPEPRRDTLCISSQVGCDVGCTFCMTAQMGFERNLTAGEILGQVLVAVRDGCLKERGFNIVFMGMGEPLYNYQNVMRAFRIMADPEGMGLSHRKITVSTSGVVPVLRKMQQEPLLPNLAVSLNATTNTVRDAVMPINRKWDLEELFQACREFPAEPRRRITFEYVLMEGVSDSDQDAHRLARLVKGMRAKVNLIPYNPNPGLPYRRPDPQRVEQFREILAGQLISAFVRKTRGDDIAAACGQLACMETYV